MKKGKRNGIVVALVAVFVAAFMMSSCQKTQYFSGIENETI